MKFDWKSGLVTVFWVCVALYAYSKWIAPQLAKSQAAGEGAE